MGYAEESCHLRTAEASEHTLESCSSSSYQEFLDEIEEAFKHIFLFEDRRAYLRHFRQHKWPLGEEEWQWMYGQLLSRNLHETPEGREEETGRRNEESSIRYSGTEQKGEGISGFRARLDSTSRRDKDRSVILI